MSALPLFAQDTAAPAAEATQNPEQPPKLMRIGNGLGVYVSTIQGMGNNIQYEQNVQALSNQYQVIQSMQLSMQASKDETVKEGLKKELDDLVKQFNEDRKLMFDAYGYTVDHQYVTVPENTHLYRMLTQKEVDELQKKADEAKAAEGGDSTLLGGEADGNEGGSLLSN